MHGKYNSHTFHSVSVAKYTIKNQDASENQLLGAYAGGDNSSECRRLGWGLLHQKEHALVRGEDIRNMLLRTMSNRLLSQCRNITSLCDIVKIESAFFGIINSQICVFAGKVQT